MHKYIDTISWSNIVRIFFIFFSGFCKALKRDDDKVVMVYSVEIYDAMYSAQWFNGMEINAAKYAVSENWLHNNGSTYFVCNYWCIKCNASNTGNTRR